MLAELEPMIGFCVTTAAVRVNVDAEPVAGLGELAAAVGDTVLEVLSRAELPFADVLGELGVERSADRTPLIQTMLTVEPTPMVAPRLAGLHAELIPHVPTASAFDLDLMIVRAGPDTGQFRMTLNYSTELFDASTADGLADRFLRLLAAGVADPVRPTSALPLLEPAERRVLQEWSGAGVAVRQPRGTVVDMILRAAAENPSAPAVRAAGRNLTYAELQAWSAAVAKVVRASGAGVDDPVAVVVPHDTELVPALLGVLRAGATYLPLDARDPAQRLRELIRAADCRAVLTTASTAALVDGSGATPLVLAPAQPPTAQPPPDRPPTAPPPTVRCRPSQTSPTCCSPPARRAGPSRSRSSIWRWPHTPRPLSTGTGSAAATGCCSSPRRRSTSCWRRCCRRWRRAAPWCCAPSRRRRPMSWTRCCTASG
jgi:non-ribosomal peptide synthetase component F